MSGSESLVLRPGESMPGKQGLDYVVGVSAATAGARGLCLQLVAIPPGGRSRAHLHAGHESALYLLSGDIVLWNGPDLMARCDATAGDFVYIPAGIPHVLVNRSATEPVEAVIARSDPNDQERIVFLPDLDALPHLDT